MGGAISLAYPTESKKLLNGTPEILNLPPSIRIVYGHELWGAHNIRPVRYFTLLRHPFDRYLSGWHHLKQWDRDNPNLPKRMPYSFHDHIIRGRSNGSQYRFNLLIGSLTGFPPKVLSLHFSQAYKILTSHFTIGLTKRFDDSLKMFNKTLGLNLKSVPKVNFRKYNREFPKRKEYEGIFRSLNSWDCDLYDAIEQTISF